MKAKLSGGSETRPDNHGEQVPGAGAANGAGGGRREVREAVADMLKHRNCDAVAGHNGEALGFLRASRAPSWILLDLNAPTTDGRAFLEARAADEQLVR